MKQICLRCNRTVNDGHLWCQEKNCPGGKNPVILEGGEWFGDLEILRFVVALETAAIYEVRRNNDILLLKIAYEGFEEKLKREAQTLLELIKFQHPALPVLLPAYLREETARHPYGKTVFRDRTLYFFVFEMVHGDTLRNFLLKNPQPWYQIAGWLLIGLADGLALLHQADRFHGCLYPEMVYMRFDREQIPRPLLLDLGAACSSAEMRRLWKPSYTLPSYMAPELIPGINENYANSTTTDVYGLGLLLFEMLAGHPTYPSTLTREGELYRMIAHGHHEPLNRPDLEKIPLIIERAIHRDTQIRPKDVAALHSELQAFLPPLPKEKKPYPWGWKHAFILLGTLLGLSLLCVTVLILPG